MYRSQRDGFTLIELLTVIAVIAILASMLFVGFSRVREMAKMRSVDNAFLQIRNLAAKYYTDNNSYPVPYGLVKPQFREDYTKYLDDLTGTVPFESHWIQTRPWTVALGLHGSTEFDDAFSLQGYDTDLDGQISVLEYLPIGYKANATAAPIFTQDLYVPGNITAAVDIELGLMNQAQFRPFTYIAVNKRQATLAQRYWVKTGDLLASTWDWNDEDLSGITVPAPTFDAFVIISMGPGGNTGGILNPPSNPVQPLNTQELYHVASLRAFYLATRDLDEDGTPDLSFQGRSTRGQEYVYDKVSNLTTTNELPNGHPYGPYVFSYGWK